MAKASGLGQTTLSVDDASGTAKAIKNDITNWQMSTPRGVQDITGVDKSANERLLLFIEPTIARPTPTTAIRPTTTAAPAPRLIQSQRRSFDRLFRGAAKPPAAVQGVAPAGGNCGKFKSGKPRGSKSDTG